MSLADPCCDSTHLFVLDRCRAKPFRFQFKLWIPLSQNEIRREGNGTVKTLQVCIRLEMILQLHFPWRAGCFCHEANNSIPSFAFILLSMIPSARCKPAGPRIYCISGRPYATTTKTVCQQRVERFLPHSRILCNSPIRPHPQSSLLASPITRPPETRHAVSARSHHHRVLAT